MKNQYAGDIGDYGKYGMLRFFASRGIKIGINWYLTSNDDRSDGNHTEYLLDARMRAYDPAVYDAMKCLAFDSGRSVHMVEQNGILEGMMFYHEPLITTSTNGKTYADRRFTLSMGSVKAEGEATADGFVVFKGATLNEKTSVKSLNKKAAARRDAIIASEKVDNNMTTEDMLFTSPSAAADFLVGYSVSGPASWKDKNGTALKDRSDL